jgi:hypothetical protein
LAPGRTVLLTIDDAERERIRHGLNRYKELHGGIGDPELCERIVAATNLPVRLSTLQRFLKGKHRTDDAAVHRYKKFLQMVAPPPAEDELGRALLTFFHVQPGADGDLSAMAGVYATRTRPYVGLGLSLPEHIAAWRPVRDPSRACTAPWSTIRLTAESGTPFLQVREHVVQPRFDTLEKKLNLRSDLSSYWMGNTGILLPVSKAEYLMMVRSFLEARVYLLRKEPGDSVVLRGVVFQSSGVVLTPWTHKQPAFEIEMTRDASSAASDEKPA